MRGEFMDQGRLFSYVSPEARVPANHPLRKIRELVRDVLGELNRDLSKLYANDGRPSGSGTTSDQHRACDADLALRGTSCQHLAHHVAFARAHQSD